MKKFLALFLSAAALACVLTGCADRQEPSSSVSSAFSSEGVPVPDQLPALPPEPPVLDWVKDTAVPDFLDADQKALYLRAFSAAQFLLGPSTAIVEDFPLADGSYLDMTGAAPHETVTVDGYEYCIARGRYSRWEDFQAMLDGLFTPEYQKTLLKPEDSPVLFFSSEDGETCYLNGARGSNAFYEAAGQDDEFRSDKQTDDTIQFTLIGHYADFTQDENGKEVMGESYTEEYPMELVRTDRGWRFDLFHIPY